MTRPDTLPRIHVQRLSAVGPAGSQAGLTLLELLISITLGLLLLFGIGTVYVSSSKTYRVQENNARIQENGRYYLDIIGRSLRQAGAAAPMDANPIVAFTTCIAPTCTAITGTNTTLTVQFYAGFDENNSGTWGTRDCAGNFAAANPTPTTTTLIQNTFALSGTDLRCTATRTPFSITTQTLGTPVVSPPTPLISDVKDFQVLYGVDTDNDQSANLYTTSPTLAQEQCLPAPGAAPCVITAKVCVLTQSTDPGVTNVAQKYLNCAGALGTATGAAAFTTAGDSRLYRAFVANFNLRNRVITPP